MTRPLSEATITKITLMLQGDYSLRDIAISCQVGAGSVARVKKKLGLSKQYRLRAEPNEAVVVPFRTISPAARRLAEFDPIVRRALSEPEDAS